jgi:CO/xanthine dehydrogenase Mo-binding subunit
MRLRTGVKNDGTITGVHLQTLVDGGAYGSYGVASVFYTGALQTVTYHIPRYRFDGCRVFTNKPPCGPKRGHGTPQPRFGQEVQLDKIAEKLNLDPAELRLRIAEAPRALTANYLQLGTIGLSDCLRKVVERSGWRDKFRRLGPGRGVGLACSAYLSGAGLPIYWNSMPHSGVQLKLDRSGLVTLLSGTTEIGQGSDDVQVAIVAEVLGLPPRDVYAVTGDTHLGPVDLGSYSSRVTLMAGNAALQAAERARDLTRGGGCRLPRRWRLPRSATARSAPSVRIRRRRRRPASRGAASVRRQPIPTAPLFLRWRSTPLPAGFTSRKSIWRTISGAPSTRPWHAARSRAASTWRWARP